MLNNKILHFYIFGSYPHIFADNFGSLEFVFDTFDTIGHNFDFHPSDKKFV